jgi:prefoldin subunit 5
MTELTEQQKHLSQLIEQQNQLVTEINALNNQLATKREIFIKVQGVIEYLQQTGVSREPTETPELTDPEEL